ncbi:MAG: type II toxin-antitoxin system PemK/MazF family toxin [Planctomycetota bacterium]
MPRNPIPTRGDVWLVSLDPTIGDEVQKTRPAVVVTSNIYNRHNWVVVIMPLTSHDTAEYDQVMIEPPEGGVTSTSVTLPDQIRSVDRRRLIKRLGCVCQDSLHRIDRSLKIVLDLL